MADLPASDSVTTAKVTLTPAAVDVDFPHLVGGDLDIATHRQVILRGHQPSAGGGISRWSRYPSRPSARRSKS